MNIFICTYAKDFRYLRWCLKSIEKFATGFDGLTIAVHAEDEKELRTFAPSFAEVHPYVPWPGKPFLCHEAQIVRADGHCPKADMILFMDSDCIFTEPVRPEDYLIGGNPVLMHASFEWLTKDRPDVGVWQTVTERALGFPVLQELMRRHPAVHHRKVFRKTRECIIMTHGCPMDDYLKEQQDGFPYGFAEFPALGAVAWKFFHGDYHWWNQQTHGFPHSKLVQFWGHGALDEPQDIRIGSGFTKDKPINVIQKYLA